MLVHRVCSRNPAHGLIIPLEDKPSFRSTYLDGPRGIAPKRCSRDKDDSSYTDRHRLLQSYLRQPMRQDIHGDTCVQGKVSFRFIYTDDYDSGICHLLYFFPFFLQVTVRVLQSKVNWLIPIEKNIPNYILNLGLFSLTVTQA